MFCKTIWSLNPSLVALPLMSPNFRKIYSCCAMLSPPVMMVNAMLWSLVLYAFALHYCLLSYRSSLCRGWQFGHQPERDGELVQLEMGLEKADRAIAARLARDFGNLNARFLQRMLRLQLHPRVFRTHDIVADPAVQIDFAFFAGHEAADLIPHDRFQVMSEARHRKQVLQLGRKPRVGVCGIGVVFLRFLAGLRAKKRRIVGALAMHQRDEPEIGQFFFPAVSDGD